MHVIAQQLPGELIVSDITVKVRGENKTCKIESLAFSFMFSVYLKETEAINCPQYFVGVFFWGKITKGSNQGTQGIPHFL